MVDIFNDKPPEVALEPNRDIQELCKRLREYSKVIKEQKKKLEAAHRDRYIARYI